MRRSLVYLVAGLTYFNAYSADLGQAEKQSQREEPAKVVSAQNYSAKPVSKSLVGITAQPALLAEQEASKETWGKKIKKIIFLGPEEIEQRRELDKSDVTSLVNYIEDEMPVVSTYLGPGIKELRESAERKGREIKYWVDERLPFGLELYGNLSGNTIRIGLNRPF